MHPLFERLRNRGWTVKPPVGTRPLLPLHVAARYPTLPSEVVNLLSSVDLCVHPNEQSWFVTRDTIYLPDGTVEWNRFEQMVLAHDLDEGYRQRIVSYWDNHFPLVLTVHSDYDFFALALEGSPFAGGVVHGCAYTLDEEQLPPEAPSFEAFLQGLTDACELAEAPWPWDLILQTWWPREGS